ncbi:hypothetical protein K0M31_013977 [Melipona bicolor]|uniref:Uncharacterized protein n=1 Tax=Melipona bicolor TaxID=60889 RepID=A0AA40G7L8_9HYME|nr:hypothetical protein K0M31_013977 [Melipona bicolor]
MEDHRRNVPSSHERFTNNALPLNRKKRGTLEREDAHKERFVGRRITSIGETMLGFVGGSPNRPGRGCDAEEWECFPLPAKFPPYSQSAVLPDLCNSLSSLLPLLLPSRNDPNPAILR